MSLTSCEALKDRKTVKRASLVLTILIIMSTMLLKQHSVIDVCMGATLALFGYLVFYPQKALETSVLPDWSSYKRHRKNYKL